MAEVETIEEYLARGGGITNCKDPSDYPLFKYTMRLLKGARSRANKARRADLTYGRKEEKLQKLGAKCDLSYKWIEERLRRGVCEVTGIPFDLERVQDGRTTNPWAPSIDRTDSFDGYTKDNCKIVVWIYNRAKGEDSTEDVLKLAEALVEKKNEEKRI